MTSSYPNKDTPRGVVSSSADKATTQPKKGVPGKRERRSPSSVEDATDGDDMEDAERKGAEERIRFQAKLLDAVGQAAIATDLEGKVTYWNRAAEEIYGWSKEEVIGQTLSEFVISEDLRERANEIRTGLREGNTWAGEFIVQRKDGTTFPAIVINTPVHDEQGNLVGMIGVSTDITERKRAEEALKESEERFRTTFDDAPVGVALVDLGGRRFRANRSLCEMLGCSEEDLLGANYLENVHPDDRQISKEHFQRALEGEAGGYELERRYLHADGHVVWNQTSVSLIRDSEGNPSYFVCLHQDITERKRVEHALRSSEEFFRALYEKVHHPIFLFDKDLNFVDVNPYACEFFGYSREKFKRMKLSEITLPEELEEQLASVETMRKQGEIFILERRLRKKNGEIVTVLADAIKITRADQELYVSKVNDITERKEAEKRLRYQATHDLLTDLPNRHLFIDRLKSALRLTRRRKGRKVAVLYLDMDNFKVVNDSLGHEAGDLLLVAVGERMRWCLRPEDTLARFGGDEFAVLLEEVEAPSDAARVAERILERFREPFVIEGREFIVEPSIGIALGEARTRRPEELLRDADTAMYQAKGQDGHYRVFDPAMYEQALRRLKLEGDLRRAIKDEEFVMCYQPIVDLQTEKVWGVEALVRWELPEQRGLIASSQFIPIAEEAGLVVPIGRWVLEEACRQGAKWHQNDPNIPPLVMVVNLSAKQLQHPDVAEIVEKTLKETGLDGGCLCLDITETLYIRALEGHTAVLDKLKRMGVRISIDDFGTGYSSLVYLKRLPADALKIDKSFIKGIGEDIEDTAIVRMIIELAHTLGMEVVEGVESEWQIEQLKEMGCDRAQGFYFAEPLSPKEAAKYLAR